MVLRRSVVVLCALVLALAVAGCVTYAAELKGEHQLALEFVDGKFGIVTSEVLSYEMKVGTLSLAVDVGKQFGGEQWILTELAFTKQVFVVDVTLGVSHRWLPAASNKVFLLFAYPW